jgi:hypothetical protein
MKNIEFTAGDEVLLADGPYQGTPGVFLNRMPADANWAEIKERNDVVRDHPVVWLQHFQHNSDEALGPQIQSALGHHNDS